jgi:hypothetical protein
MTDNPALSAEMFPQLAKVHAVRLPMKTIKEFLNWLMEQNPNFELSAVWEHVDGLLLNYYSIDPQALADEIARRQG